MIVEKINTLKASFEGKSGSESIYTEIMAWGNKLESFESAWRTENNLIEGCQSTMYLHCEVREDSLFFFADSDALISRGLAAILIFLYNGESAMTILNNPPLFLAELGLLASLSPGRSNGFASLYRAIRQHALTILQTKPNPEFSQYLQSKDKSGIGHHSDN